MADLLEQLRTGLSDRYRVEREIGAGGMALVFLAEDLRHRRKVAIKIIRPDVGSAVGGERFLREIEIAARFTHPHVLPLHDSGECDGLLYYVMPFVEGESLRERMLRERVLPLRDALRIGADVADALSYAHGCGVVHRDIKPENIMLSAGHALVTDFGIARALSAGAEQLTRTGIAIGTVQYMSPEQAAGDPVDGRSDVYSLGAVLHEMLTGRTPFTGSNARSVMAQVISEEPPRLTPTDGIPPDIAEVVHRALARNPGDRFQTAEEFARALEELSSSVATATSAGRRRPGRRMGAALGIAVLLVGGGLVWSAMHSREGIRSDSSSRIAVLPFTVHGSPQLNYLSHGIVDLLSRNLEGVGGLSAIDPGTMISSLRSGNSTEAVFDAEAGRTIARRFGAGSVVVGSVNSAGARVRIQAALHDANNGEDAVARASVEGDTTELLGLVDRLAAQLLVNRRAGAAERLSQTAAITTHSLPALKAFLNAEQQLRARALDSAISGYQRAITEDSSFALAYYRLAVAAGWAERHALSNEAARRGVQLAERLTERDRRLITAYATYRRGAADDAERQYRGVLEDFPDDLEAEFQLGDLLYQYNPLRGRPRLEARPLLDKVLVLDPGFL